MTIAGNDIFISLHMPQRWNLGFSSLHPDLVVLSENNIVHDISVENGDECVTVKGITDISSLT